MPVGVIATSPCDGDASIRRLSQGRPFVRFWRRVHIPLSSTRTCRGFGRASTRSRGIIKHGAKLIYAFCEATVPRITSSRERLTARLHFLAPNNPRGRQSGLPRGRDRGHGRRGCVNNHLPDDIKCPTDPARRDAASCGRLPGEVLQSLQGRRAWVHRRSHRSPTRAPRFIQALRMLKSKRTPSAKETRHIPL